MKKKTAKNHKHQWHLEVVDDSDLKEGCLIYECDCGVYKLAEKKNEGKK